MHGGAGWTMDPSADLLRHRSAPLAFLPTLLQGTEILGVSTERSLVPKDFGISGASMKGCKIVLLFFSVSLELIEDRCGRQRING